MADNITKTVSSLAGDALIIGGGCFIGYGVLKSVSGISKGLTDALEYLPRAINDPSKSIEDVQKSDVNYVEKIMNTGFKIGVIGMIFVVGVGMKRIGLALKDGDLQNILNGVLRK